MVAQPFQVAIAVLHPVKSCQGIQLDEFLGVKALVDVPVPPAEVRLDYGECLEGRRTARLASMPFFPGTSSMLSKPCPERTERFAQYPCFQSLSLLSIPSLCGSVPLEQSDCSFENSGECSFENSLGELTVPFGTVPFSILGVDFST